MNNSANYIELCFPTQVNMNGSQPNLATVSINKVRGKDLGSNSSHSSGSF